MATHLCEPGSLMDRETLDAHQHLRSDEVSPHAGRLDHLTEAEQSLYDDLRYDRLGRRVRLEQERIAFGWLQHALAELAVVSDTSMGLP